MSSFNGKNLIFDRSISKTQISFNLSRSFFRCVRTTTIISIEIVDSKKEIGILRSIGLSGGKVAFIFVFQAASVIFLSYFLGVFGGYKIVPLLNNGITDEFGKVTLYMYTFTYRTPLYLALLVIGMTSISTIIPLFKILSQKIIDVINERDN